MANDKTQKERIKELKKTLYSRTKEIKTRRRRAIGSGRPTAYSDWAQKKAPVAPIKHRHKKSFLKKFFMISLGFFVVSILFAFQMFSGGSNVVSSKNIELNMSGPVSLGGGEELILQLELINNNNTDLQLADLIVEYPEGTISDLGSEKKINKVRYSLGTVRAGGKVEKSIKAVIFGEGGSEKSIKTVLEYRIEGSNAIFIKESEYRVGITSSPVNLSIDFLKEANSNQEIDLRVTVSSNSNTIIENDMVQIDYPFGFEFISSSPQPAFKDNIWSLGDLAPETERVINIRGVIKGQDGEEKVFRVYNGPQDSSNERAIGVAYNTVTESLMIKKPFLGATLVINGDFSEEYVLKSGQKINGEIMWSNNLPTRIRDGEIEVKILGNIIDKRTVFADRGFYNSSTNTITWSKDNYDDLAIIEPGDKGRISFSFPHLPLSQGGGTLESPEIILELSIKGKRSSGGSVPEEIKTSVKTIIKISSDIQLTPRAVYNSGPFSNSGPMPPQAEKETTYTIIWSVVNSSNDIAGARVQANLPSYVKWQNMISPSSNDISFNENTGEIIWNIGNVPAGTGLSLQRKEVSFQVALTPSVSQVGDIPVLVSEALLTGRDVFTGTTIKSSRGAVSTRLSTDPAYRPGDETVVNMID